MSQSTIGQRVRRLRESRDMTREALAAALGCSAEWVKKFEGGHRQADPKLSTLRDLARVLNVPLSQLVDDPASDARCRPEDDDTVLLRAVLLTPMTGETRGTDLERLWDECAYGFTAFQAGHYSALLRTLPKLVTTARALPDDPASARCAYRAHHLAAITLMKFNGGPAAWTAANRAVAFAETSGDPVALALAAQSLVYTMTTIGAAALGMDTAESYATRLEHGLSDGSVPSATALGMLWLKGAVAAADNHNPVAAQQMLAQARRCAEQVPTGANYLFSGFDQLNVLLYQVSIDAALARYVPAADGADWIRPDALDALPPERRTHHLIEAATTYTRLGRTADALAALLRAEGANRAELRTRPAARDAIQALLDVPGPRPERLRALARRAGLAA